MLEASLKEEKSSLMLGFYLTLVRIATINDTNNRKCW
jgi:hypothetical protein